MSKHKIILVSSSPRRKELLSKILPEFSITPHKISENILNNEDGLTYVKRLAKEKANLENIKKNEILISADTIILFNNTIIGKPTSFEDAKRIISLLSDNKHEVITAVCIKDYKREYVFSAKTRVVFNSISTDLINQYLHKQTYSDKAAGYGIQQDDYNFIKYIEGSYTNVMGLPMKELIDHLNNLYNLGISYNEIDTLEHSYPKKNKTNEDKRNHRYKYSFEIDQDKCITCDWCIKEKPHDNCILMFDELKLDKRNNIISSKKTERFREANYIWINSDECTRCGICMQVCPVNAISRKRN